MIDLPDDLLQVERGRLYPVYAVLGRLFRWRYFKVRKMIVDGRCAVSVDRKLILGAEIMRLAGDPDGVILRPRETLTERKRRNKADAEAARAAL